MVLWAATIARLVWRLIFDCADLTTEHTKNAQSFSHKNSETSAVVTF